MEAVPKVPMLQFNLKQSQQKSSFSRLKQYIAECYQEDPETFSKEIYELETLRAAAYNPSNDVNGCNLIKRYYCQLHSLQNRFPLENDRNLVTFSWRDVYSNNTTQSTELRNDMAVVLYNYGALHTQLGASVNRSTEDEMKLACTHFQCAAWAFETVREKFHSACTNDMYPEIMIFMQNICFAQAQECILEKSLIDNRKAIIVAKVTAQIIEYYNSAFAAILSGGEEGVISEMVGAKQFKEWRQYIQFKVQYMACILLLYQGQNAEEQQKMGERVTLYQAAFDRLEDARKEAKHLNQMTPQINDALQFVMDVVEAKRKAAKNENEFIYHEEVPELSSIATVAGANLVKGTPFNVADSAVAAEDIFHRLVPIKTHENSSLYSEEKANLLRKITGKIEAKDNELNKFMESLNIDSLQCDSNNVKLPQALIDRCADLNAKPNAIPDLISKMSSLAEICVDVENTLQIIGDLLSKEENYEKEFQQTMGYRPNGHFIELHREFMKYQEAHSKAGGSNDTLRKAMELHVNNLRILAKPLAEVQAAIPTHSIEIDPTLLNETRMLLNKVNEMRVQRAQLYAQLNENIQNDDITARLIAWGENDVDKLFKTELAKHEKLIAIIEQNMVAQQNILKSFTDAYAKCAHFIKSVAETKHKRDIFFSSLIASYDVYDDLLGKSLKGLEFYKKLQNNIHKLGARVRSACEVQDEERQQRLESINKKASAFAPTQKPSATIAAPMPSANVNMNAEYPTIPTMKSSELEKYDSYRSSSIRPTPIGQENTANMPTSNYIHPPVPSVTQVSQPSAGFTFPSQPNAPTNVPLNKTNDAAGNVPYTNQQSKPFYSSGPVHTQISQVNTFNSTPGYSTASGTAGFVNPMYNHLPATDSTKMYYGDKSAMQDATLASPNISSSQRYTVPSNYIPSTVNSSIATPTNQNNAYTSGSNANVPIQPQAYSNYSSNTSAYPSSQYVATSQPSSINARYSSQAIPSGYQAPNMTTNTLQNTRQQQQHPQSQHYQMGTTYSDYSVPNQMNAYQQPPFTPTTFAQPIDSRYPAFTAPQTHAALPDTSMNYVQPQQPISSTMNMQYNSYSTMAAQPSQHIQPNAIAPESNNPKSVDGSHYNPNPYYGNQTNVQNTQYPVMQNNINSTGYTSNYGVQANYINSNQPNQTYSHGINEANVAPPNPVVDNYGQSQQPQMMPPVNPVGQPSNQQANVPVQVKQQSKPASSVGKNSKSPKVDWLSELENIPIPTPALQPIKSTTASQVPNETTASNVLAPSSSDAAPNPSDMKANPKIEAMKSSETIPNVSIESNDSIENALTQLSLSEELLSNPILDTTDKTVSRSNTDLSATASSTAASTPASTAAATGVPASSVVIENFYKELQRYEKIVNGLSTKTLNGTTPLEIKWKELMDLLDKDAGKRTANVSKLFPEKNRNMLSVPYDHSRVLLPTDTDNYINAAHVRSLGTQNNHYILADAPTFNTVKDFWCMIWSQQSKLVICLNTPDEGPTLLFPKQLNVSQTFGEYTITVLTEHHRLFVIERSMQVTSSETNATRTITVLQAKQWPDKNSTTNIIGVSQNIIEVISTIRAEDKAPIILNCLTNLERSSLVTLSITSILALETEKPMIINASDVWYRICSQRKNILNDLSILQLSMQIILQCCRDYIKKKSPKTLSNNSQINYYFIEEEESPIKDPFKDLDPLWKLK